MCNISNETSCLQLELRSTAPSTPSIIVDEQGNVIDSHDGSREPIQFVFEEIHWSSEIDVEEAARRMEVTFYPFKKVIVYMNKWCLCYSRRCQRNRGSFTNALLLHRCPTCLFLRLSSGLKQRRSWCTLFCCGEL